MCGRFTLRTSPQAVADAFQLPLLPDLAPRYNIAPTQTVAAVRAHATSSQRELALLHWGLVPRWAEDPSAGSRMINARSETLATKPAFREAFQQRRCLIPADGFFEWQKQGAKKQPYLIARPDGGLFAFAGLWESWGRDGLRIESCTIITTTANQVLEPLHDRMPVILPPQDYERWLDPERTNPADLVELLRPCPNDWLVTRPVSSKVNRAGLDSSACVEPAAATPTTEQRMLF